MLPFVKTNANNKILNQLLYANCLSFGRSPKLNNRKINHYIFGTRQKFDIFKLYEMRYLILKVYPIIHNLFLQERLNKKIKKKWWFFPRDFDFQTKNFPKIFRNYKNFRDLKNKFNKKLKEKVSRTFPPKILFATTTNIYSEIVSSAAKKCRMPFHVNRWLSGSVTAASYYKNDKKKWSFLLNTFEGEYMTSQFQTQFFKHKKNFELQKKKIWKSHLNRKPTLIIIPDVANNERILKETNSIGIPALGLVNSHCNVEIAYPIFANDLSLYSVHFFCHFLSTLIFKEFVKHKHKIATSRKNIRPLQFTQAMKDVFRFNQRNFSEKFFQVKTELKTSFRKSYEKKIQNINLKTRSRKRIQNIKTDVRKQYKKKLSNAKNLVLKFFRTKAYKKKKKTDQVWKSKFKGKYFIEHFPKARRKIKRNIQKKSKVDEKPKRRLVSPKKLISIENQKRLTKNQSNFYLKKRLVSKIQLVQKLRYYNFPKILKAIRLPKNKPAFRYWNQRKFYFAKPVKFTGILPFGYTFRRYTLNQILRRRIGFKPKRKHRAEKRNFWNNKNKASMKKNSYRKRWSTKKSIKGNRK